MIQIGMGVGSITFSNMGPMWGLHVILMTKSICFMFFLLSILLFWVIKHPFTCIKIIMLTG